MLLELEDLQQAGKERGEHAGEQKWMTAAEPALWDQEEAEPLRPAAAMRTASLQTSVAVSPHHLYPSLLSSFCLCSVKY